MLADGLRDILKAEKSAGEKDAVHPAAEHRCHSADVLDDLIFHAVPDANSLPVPFLHHFVNGVGAGRPEMAHKAAGTGAELFDLVNVFIADIFKNIRHRDRTDARRGIRPVSPGGVVAVDDAPLPVRRYGNAAVDVAHDETAVLVLLSERMLSMVHRNAAEIERVHIGVARYIGNAGHARHVAQFVHTRRVHHKDLAAKLLLQLARKLHAEIGRMLHAALPGAGVADELIVDDIYAARYGITAPAAADDGVHIRKIDAVFAEKVHDDFFAVRQLRIHRRKLQKHGRVVEHLGFQYFLIVRKERQLG